MLLGSGLVIDLKSQMGVLLFLLMCQMSDDAKAFHR